MICMIPATHGAKTFYNQGLQGFHQICKRSVRTRDVDISLMLRTLFFSGNIYIYMYTHIPSKCYQVVSLVLVKFKTRPRERNKRFDSTSSGR